MSTRIRTAVIPAGGLGTRLLPLTRAVPKELLPVWNRPVLDYAIEEAMAAGIERVVIVTAPGKEALRNHFAERHALPGCNRDAPPAVFSLEFVEQSEPLGLGDAVRRGAPAGEAIAVLLPDELLIGPNCLAQLIACRSRDGGSAIAVKRVPRAEVGRYGIVAVECSGPIVRVRDLVEKPQPAAAPSDLAVIGRYVLAAEVMERLAKARPTVNGEVQLTDSIAATCGTSGVSAVEYDGLRFDCGSFAGLLEANIAVARREQAQAAAARPAKPPETRPGTQREADAEASAA
ncbi:MAG TPA: sugar phosphate nucleotidyltransferase [Dongiaceae bacterium]|jgi:UTP--glucose-1-phosphate uridylyltransferase|nr:sugar phosphate nucleotidyltransferase [Dongiaceae bacterium]